MVAIYTRVSTSEQAEKGYSIEEQAERAKNYCQALNLSVYKVYSDPGFSGSNMDRPALRSMIDDLQNKKVDKVIVYKLDRLSRSQLDTLFIIENIILASGAEFISISENFDTSSPFGRAMIGILAVFAQLEREQIKERMTLGKLARAKTGKNTSSVAPIGYDLIEGKLIPNPYEKMQIEELFRLYASGSSPLQIERLFNEKGYSHKYGKWKQVTIRKILLRRTYIGESPFGGKWYPGEHEPIISKELFDSAQSVRIRKADDHFENTHYAGEATSYLAGLLFCGNCGARYSKETSRTRSTSGVLHEYVYYSCQSRIRKNYRTVRDPNCKNRRIKMSELDRIVFDEIKKLATDPDYIETVKDSEPDDRLKILRSELNKIETQINRLLDLFATSSAPADMIQGKISELNDQRKKLSDEIESCQHEKKIESEQAGKMIGSFSDVLESGTFEEIRALLFALIDRIVIFDDDIEIHWNF